MRPMLALLIALPSVASVPYAHIAGGVDSGIVAPDTLVLPTVSGSYDDGTTPRPGLIRSYQGFAHQQLLLGR